MDGYFEFKSGRSLVFNEEAEVHLVMNIVMRIGLRIAESCDEQANKKLCCWRCVLEVNAYPNSHIGREVQSVQKDFFSPVFTLEFSSVPPIWDHFQSLMKGRKTGV